MAVRWLREEAIRTAGLVDPEPDAKWLRGGRAVLVSPTPGSPDVPQVLRDWADDEALQGAAMAVLAKREFFHFYTSDGQTGYSLSAMPLPVGFAGDWAAEIGAPSTA
ncbi:hypothetical protein [Streptomyces sp. NPDC001546]|uniref:hypothetical protein n=1 Tax=Streptomyces sp. NPDC001546 TaxID=3364585 RepID=UPI003699F873